MSLCSLVAVQPRDRAPHRPGIGAKRKPQLDNAPSRRQARGLDGARQSARQCASLVARALSCVPSLPIHSLTQAKERRPAPGLPIKAARAPPRTMSTSTHYTFGDNDLAMDRLRVLADTFAASSAAFLATLPVLVPGSTAIDLGCGLGYTTDLVARSLSPTHLFGLDASARILERARSRSPSVATYLVHDVTSAAFPVAEVDFAYARFLLTHLPNVVGALAAWRRAVRAGATLAIEETYAMRSVHPAFVRYYELVGSLQAHYGQATSVGEQLEAAAPEAGWEIERAERASLAIPASTMAQLHAMNVRTWRHDPAARHAFDAREIDALTTTLAAIASGEMPAPAVSIVMMQMVLRA
jgi:trans-aconitate 2-methyltransferase